MNTINFSNEDIDKILKIEAKNRKAIDNSLSVSQNMVNILKSEFEEIDSELAGNIAKELLDGVVSFNDAYDNLCNNDDYKLIDKVKDTLSELPLEERAKAIINYIAIIKCLDSEIVGANLNEETVDFLEQFESIRSENGLDISEDLTEEKLNELESILEEALNNSCICLTGDAQVQTLLKGMAVDDTNVEEYLKNVNEHIDFKAYAAAQQRVEEAYRDEKRWARMAMLNVAKSGKFTSDRTIQQYVDEIWHLDKVKVEPTESNF